MVRIKSINSQLVQCLISDANIKLRLNYLFNEGSITFTDEKCLAETISYSLIHSFIKGKLRVGIALTVFLFHILHLLKKHVFPQ